MLNLLCTVYFNHSAQLYTTGGGAFSLNNNNTKEMSKFTPPSEIRSMSVLICITRQNASLTQNNKLHTFPLPPTAQPPTAQPPKNSTTAHSATAYSETAKKQRNRPQRNRPQRNRQQRNRPQRNRLQHSRPQRNRQQRHRPQHGRPQRTDHGRCSEFISIIHISFIYISITFSGRSVTDSN